MNLASGSSTTNLSRTSMSLRCSAASAQQQQRSLPSMERMTLGMLLQPRSNHNHPGDEDSGETVRVRLCSYLQQALDLVDAITIEVEHGGPQMNKTVRERWCSYLQQALDLVDVITIEVKRGGPQMSDLAVCLSPGAQRIKMTSDLAYL
jgi:hypothetical protein